MFLGVDDNVNMAASKDDFPISILYILMVLFEKSIVEINYVCVEFISIIKRLLSLFTKVSVYWLF